MKEYAIYYYKQGYNCAACILKAAEKYYNQPMSRQCYKMCEGINTGFGIGGMCSVVVSVVMVFGLLFDVETVKKLRMKLLDEINAKYNSLNCCEIIKTRKNNQKCEIVIGEIAEIAQRLIEEIK